MRASSAASAARFTAFSVFSDAANNQEDHREQQGGDQDGPSICQDKSQHLHILLSLLCDGFCFPYVLFFGLGTEQQEQDHRHDCDGHSGTDPVTVTGKEHSKLVHRQ